MSKDKTYIIVIAGVFIFIAINTIGSFKFFFYQNDTVEIGKQIVDFLIYTVPASLATGVVMAQILNFNEKKELKAQTKLSNKYQEEIIQIQKSNQETIIENAIDSQKTLARIEESIAVTEKLQETRDKEQGTRVKELDSLIKDLKIHNKREERHDKEHKEINKQFEKLDFRVAKNESFIQSLKIKNKTGS